jgi:predicted MFS family arabinose efflux permease
MDFGKALGWTLIAFGVMGVLGNVAADPHVPWHWRKVARAIEGNIYQDIFTGQFFLL